MSLDLTYQVTDIDNRDIITSILTCENEQGLMVMVEVDPIKLFVNMVENLSEDQSNILAIIDWLNGQLRWRRP